ncbi:hypothetical protein acsn021_09560 [Anaerocolumna cellulosilytica]|uniref:Uncharacterized protein n=1 Tax=Anaerocolumna cellulosilytica TaxID=433286 RepID=A0A6S6QZW5_9FIRM|nr:hypothetical protein [Anaerocolumna cellulosilytica]MBB5194442.1 hypothetical protein [Anaerocolumna cellulosilytica]BCJ93387.1 hypothetical protein acsn021_09560 [Anaerocolumna cellulosilytica]
MNDKLDKIKSKIKDYIPYNSKVALKSAATSFVLAFLGFLLCYVIFRGGTQPYHDIVVGNITLPGIYKNIDFYTYYTFIITYLIMFFTLNRYYNKKIILNENIIEISMKYIIIGILPAFAMLLIKINTIPAFNLSFCLYLITVIVGLNKTKVKKDNISKLASSCFYIYLSSAGVLALTDYYLPNVADRGTKYFVPLLWILLCIAAYVIYQFAKGKFKCYEDIAADVITSFTQLIIPLCLFSLINTRYFYQGAEYIPVYYSRLKKITIALIIILLFINIITLIRIILKKRKINSLSISTVISFTSICIWDTGYNLVINTDQFHTGETAIVYQQIVEKGQKWGSEFVSVLQGLGFSLSWLNKIVFGGKYSTYTQTQSLLLVIMAVITALLLYSIIEHKFLILLIAPIMPLFYMNRIFLIAAVFLLLLNPRIIKNPFKWSYYYILTCIVHVWYQPTYGGAVAASFIPVVILIWYKAFKNNDLFDIHNKKNRFKLAAFLLSVIIIGVCCIPLLYNAIHFLKANGYETMIGNGVSVYQTLTYEPNYLTGFKFLDIIIQFIFKFGSGLAAFIIMLYMFTRYVVRQKDEIKLIQGVILTVSATLAYFLMLPSIFTRIDPGISRIGGTSFIFFGFLVIILIYIYRSEIVFKPIAILICGLSLSACLYMTYPPYLQIHQKANSIVNIPDDAIYVKPEETGLDNLGYAFVQDEQYINEAMVINEICNYLLKENQAYYDFTDKSIYYLLTDNKVPGLYVSSMIAANEVIQTEVINQLQKNDVPLVFINKPLRYMGISESLRSYRIYRYFMEQDYRFIKYKGCNFLVRDDIDLTPVQDNIEFLDANNIIGVYDNLIDESLYNANLLEKLTQENISFENNITLNNKNMYIFGSDPYLVFESKSQTEIDNIQLIEINLKTKPISDIAGQLFVKTEKIDHNETNTIHFNIKSNKILIPLYKYDQFMLDSKLINLRLDFDNAVDGTDITVDSIKLYALDEKQKTNYNQQIEQISMNVTDNRLDDSFHQINLMNLPSQWGQSFDLMTKRFKASEVASCEQTQVEVINTSVSVHFNMNQMVPGNLGEFLRLKLDYEDENLRNATLIVKGIDKNGNNLNEEFQFVTISSNLLIPIGSSPNCLQATEITGFEIIFAPEKDPYKVKIEEAQMYQLIK